MSVLPGGYAGGLQLWLPRSGPAGGSSPMKEAHKGVMRIQTELDTVTKIGTDRPDFRHQPDSVTTKLADV